MAHGVTMKPFTVPEVTSKVTQDHRKCHPSLDPLDFDQRPEEYTVHFSDKIAKLP